MRIAGEERGSGRSGGDGEAVGRNELLGAGFARHHGRERILFYRSLDIEDVSLVLKGRKLYN